MFFAGIDIGGTKCAVVLGRKEEKMILIGKRQIPTNHPDPLVMLTKMREELSGLLFEHSVAASSLAGIGISVGGPLNSREGVVLSPPNLPTWDHVPVVAYFREAFGVPVYMQNDANACAIAEWKYGAGKGYHNLCFLTFGTGLGAGIILNDHLYTGTNDMAGEIGHMRLTAEGPVGYGKRGSMEGYCSGSGIAQLGRMAVQEQVQAGLTPRLLTEAGSEDNINAKLIADLANEGDALCRRIYAESGTKLGMGLSVLVDVLNPEIIVIGSIFVRSYELLWPYTETALRKECIPRSLNACRIAKAKLGEAVGDLAALSVATGEY